ncbi:probable tubulin polyglutamylase ttll-15 [Amphiura filiformis]|uniref:probable tubulin polyglutamylase ttll-15 n=1 Tax=Amphiura filiformis TaxID=82378 RepID=UPI003B21E7EF
MVLTTTQPSKYIPKTFVMPRDKMHFLNQIKSARYKHQLWIEKGQSHRGNQLKEIKDLNLDQNILVQEFISDQFLIHGHSFQIGVFVLFTSIEPLRFYIIQHEFSHRIAPAKFSLDDFNHTRKYVTDGHKQSKQPHTFPEMKRHYEAGYTKGQMITSYISDAGHNISKIHAQIYDAIRSVLYSGRDIMLQEYRKMYHGFKPTVSCNFFEFTRWDFILGSNMQVYLLEVNASPELNFQGLRHPRTVRSEHVLFNVLHILGADIGGRGAHGNRLRSSNVLVSKALCYKPMCESCSLEECLLCGHCLTTDHVTRLKDSLGEHLNRLQLRRLHPKPMTHGGVTSKEYWKEDIPKHERLNQAWFEEKCKQDTYIGVHNETLANINYY